MFAVILESTSRDFRATASGGNADDWNNDVERNAMLSWIE